MQYQIEIREIEPVRVAYMKYKGIAAEANREKWTCAYPQRKTLLETALK